MAIPVLHYRKGEGTYCSGKGTGRHARKSELHLTDEWDEVTCSACVRQRCKAEDVAYPAAMVLRLIDKLIHDVRFGFQGGHLSANAAADLVRHLDAAVKGYWNDPDEHSDCAEVCEFISPPPAPTFGPIDRSKTSWLRWLRDHGLLADSASAEVKA